MLRLALAAGLMATAYGYQTSGDMCMLYSFYDTNVATAAAKCGADSDGVAADAPLNTAGVDVNGARPIILGACYETDGATNKNLAMNSLFEADTATNEAYVGGADAAAATGVSWANVGGDVKMTPYTAAYAAATLADPTSGCGNTAGTAESHGAAATGTGWACADAGATHATNNGLGMGVAAAADSYAACETGVKYVTVKHELHAGEAALAGTNGTWEYGTAAGQNIDLWPVAPDEATATPAATTAKGMTEAFCFPAAFTLAGAGTAPAGSWQMVCDLETGNIERTDDINHTACAWAAATTSIFKRGSSNTTTIGVSGIQGNAQMAAVAGSALNNERSYNIVNTSLEWDDVCAIPAHTGTAKYFNGYRVDGTGCATHTDALGTTDLATANTATRSIILGVCYTLEADAQMGGWGLPFAAGAADTVLPENGATERSVKFVETGAEIEIWNYQTHDCSGAAPHSKTTSDDPADSWCTNNSKISHGAIGTSGNAATQLKAATNYLTVRKHTDASTVEVGQPGACLGIANVTTGDHLDHFIVHTNADGGPGDSPATGCHQAVKAGTDAAADADSYAWWCDTSDYSINFAEFTDNKCIEQKVNTQMKFTKKAYDTCAESDATDNTDTCTFPQAGTSPTPTSEAASAFVYGTVLTLVNGATGDFGGKCLNRANNISWEILTDDTTWDAICSAAASSSSETDDDDSSAGKVAATVAAGAAAAAALLI